MCLRTWRSRSNDGAFPYDRIGFKQHLADVVQFASFAVAELMKLPGIAKFRQHVRDVTLQGRIAQADLMIEMLAYEFHEQLPQRVRLGNGSHARLLKNEKTTNHITM